MSEKLEMPEGITQVDGTPIFLDNREEEDPSLIVNTGNFNGRISTTLPERERYEVLGLEQPGDMTIPGHALDRPLLIKLQGDSENLVTLAQHLASNELDCVDDVFESIDELRESLATVPEDEPEPQEMMDIRGAFGELHILHQSVLLAKDVPAIEAIIQSHHRGNDHVFDFTPANGSTPRDAKVFIQSHAYHAYLTSEELQHDGSAELMLVGIKTLEHSNPQGTTLAQLWAQVKTAASGATNLGELEDWITPLLASDVATRKSFMLLVDKPPKSIAIDDIPIITGLRAINGPYYRTDDAPIRLEAAPNLTEVGFLTALQTLGGSLA